MDQPGKSIRRTTRRGRKAGSDASRTTDTHLHVPYITRKIRPYDLLTDEALEQIEATAERIMAEIGFEFRDDPDCVELFRAAGAEVCETGKDVWRLKFPPGMIREVMSTAPARFTQHARNPANTVEIGGDATVLAPSYGSPFVMDLDKGRRYGTLQDFENFVKLAQSSPWLHHSGGTICEPTDIPVNKRHLIWFTPICAILTGRFWDPSQPPSGLRIRLTWRASCLAAILS